MANMTWALLATNAYTAIGTCATGTDTFGAGATDGLSLGRLTAVDLVVEADTGQTLNGACPILWMWQDPDTLRWARFPGWDETITITGVRSVKFMGPSAGTGYPVIGRSGRIAAYPNAVIVSSGGVTFRLIGTPAAAGT